MPRYKFFQSAFTAVGLILMFSACGPDDDNTCCDPTNPECPNYDACYGVEEPDAGFTMEEFLITNDGLVSAGDDSIFFNDIFFTANFQGDSITHKWYLGSEVIEEASFNRTHGTIPSSQRPTFITISHVIKYPMNHECYLRPTGIDSVSRTYRLIKYWNEFATLGTFRCQIENQTDSFDVKFAIVDENFNPADVFNPSADLVAINFHNNGDTLYDFPIITRNSLASFNGSGSQRPNGMFRLTEQPRIYTMDYILYLNSYILTARKID